MAQHVVSTKTLINSSLAATFFAALVFVCIILPAEYNIDPTTIGQKLGLTILSDTDHAITSGKSDTDFEPVTTADISDNHSVHGQKKIEVSVPAGRGIEYKFHMNQYEKMHYEWFTDGIALFFDLHGEPDGDTTGYFESYAIANLNKMKGSFTAPFTGSHGWYWKNSSDKPVAIQLSVEGQFKVIGLK